MALTELFTDIANAIREKDGTTEAIVANSFPARIRALPASGGTSSVAPDPVEVYNSTRPVDWLPMPEPADDEMYLLFHIPDGVSSLLAFTVTCTGPYTVALGTVTDRRFVQQSAVSVTSGSKYEAELFASDYGNLTSTGMKQVMVKVSGADIKTWEPSTHSRKASPSNFSIWNIVDISCRLPSGTWVGCGSNTSDKALKNLRYFSWKGENSVTNMVGMFQNCSSLMTIPQLGTSNVTNMSNMFQSCYSLTAIPQLNTSCVTNMSDMFSRCFSLTTIPQLDTSSVTNMNRMFQNCYSLTAIPQLGTSNVTSMYSVFDGCRSLAKAALKPSVTGWTGLNISLSDCSLWHDALVNLFNSLPSITSAKILTITGNPGVSKLTDAEKAIATGKNWALAT